MCWCACRWKKAPQTRRHSCRWVMRVCGHAAVDVGLCGEDVWTCSWVVWACVWMCRHAAGGCACLVAVCGHAAGMGTQGREQAPPDEPGNRPSHPAEPTGTPSQGHQHTQTRPPAHPDEATSTPSRGHQHTQPRPPAHPDEATSTPRRGHQHTQPRPPAHPAEATSTLQCGVHSDASKQRVQLTHSIHTFSSIHTVSSIRRASKHVPSQPWGCFLLVMLQTAADGQTAQRCPPTPPFPPCPPDAHTHHLWTVTACLLLQQPLQDVEAFFLQPSMSVFAGSIPSRVIGASHASVPVLGLIIFGINFEPS
eukprot:365294-Chlamydomonas_euryale.AAC.15